MSARSIDFEDARDPFEATGRIVAIRFAECLAAGVAIVSEDEDRLHALRITCKRMRYALERFARELPQMQPAATQLVEIQDALGSVHDCALLRDLARKRGAHSMLRRAAHEYAENLRRARQLWRDAFAYGGPFEALIRYAGFEGYRDADRPDRN